LCILPPSRLCDIHALEFLGVQIVEVAVADHGAVVTVVGPLFSTR